MKHITPTPKSGSLPIPVVPIGLANREAATKAFSSTSAAVVASSVGKHMSTTIHNSNRAHDQTNKRYMWSGNPYHFPKPVYSNGRMLKSRTVGITYLESSWSCPFGIWQTDVIFDAELHVYVRDYSTIPPRSWLKPMAMEINVSNTQRIILYITMYFTVTIRFRVSFEIILWWKHTTLHFLLMQISNKCMK